MYIIRNSKGNYLTRDKHNHYSITTTFSKALSFEDYQKAQNTVGNLPKRLRNKGYEVYSIDLNASNIIPLRMASNNSALNSDVLQLVSDMSQLVDTFCKRKEDLSKQLSKVQKELNDIDHYIELYSLSASEGYKIAKRRQDCLQKRREIKNQITEVTILSQMKETQGDKLMTQLKAIKDKTYHPRVLTELFQKKA